jgi:hypothetical protein
MKPAISTTVCATALVLMLSAFAAGAAEMKTAKERLSDKASDEQRVDNCGVLPERRGPVPRPDCAEKAPSPGSRERRGSSMVEALGEDIDDDHSRDDEGEADDRRQIELLPVEDEGDR